jgi:DnaJ-class molecular chaperone
MSRWQSATCTTCKGSGHRGGKGEGYCETCKGTGRMPAKP